MDVKALRTVHVLKIPPLDVLGEYPAHAPLLSCVSLR